MQFLLIDIGVTLAALLGFRAFELVRRRQAASVTLGRMRRRAAPPFASGHPADAHTPGRLTPRA